MKMFSLLTAAALFSSIAVTYAAEPVTLTDTQLDAVVAGNATASINFTVNASGPASAEATGDKVTVTAQTTGGLSPSNTATISGTFTAKSS